MFGIQAIHKEPVRPAMQKSVVYALPVVAAVCEGRTEEDK